MNEKWPFTSQVVPTPGNLGNPSINPMPSMPSEQFMRSIDPPEGSGGVPGGGGGTAGDWPFKLVAVDTENVKVLLGTVSGNIPTGVATDIDVSGTDGLWYFYIHLALDGSGVITAADLESIVGGPVPTDDATNSYRLVGRVTVASSVIVGDPEASMAWAQNFTACTPGTPPYSWTTGA